ncbi:MAG: hypothetical protein R2788_23380 [Saprospiraceae bacterium]
MMLPATSWGLIPDSWGVCPGVESWFNLSFLVARESLMASNTKTEVGAVDGAEVKGCATPQRPVHAVFYLFSGLPAKERCV